MLLFRRATPVPAFYRPHDLLNSLLKIILAFILVLMVLRVMNSRSAYKAHCPLAYTASQMFEQMTHRRWHEIRVLNRQVTLVPVEANYTLRCIF